jgi:tetratricopeptide (TPR) repeat protein
MRSLNGRYLVKLIAGTVVGVGVVAGVHYYQVRRGARALIARADAAERQGDAAKAEEYLNLYIGYEPRDADALARLARLVESGARDSGDLYRAMQIYEQVVRLRPERKEDRLRLVRLAMRPQFARVTDPREHLKILLEGDPKNAELEALLADSRSAQGQFDEARKLYERSLEHDPRRIATYVSLATLLRGRLDLAEKADLLIDSMVDSNPDSFAARLARGEYRERVGLPANPDDLKRAAELGPDDAGVLLAVARAELARKDPNVPKALALVTRGVKLYPLDARFYRERAWAEELAGHPEAALAAVRAGVAALGRERSEEQTRARRDLESLLAHLLVQSGSVAEARKALAGLKAAGAASEFVEFLEARVALGEGKQKEAVATLERILPALAARRDWLGLARQAHVLLGACYESERTFDQAYSEYRRALALDPRDGAARLGLARVLEQTGRIEPAIEEYKQVLADRPRTAVDVARLTVLRTLRQPSAQRQWGEAEAAVSRAEKAAPDARELPILRAEVLSRSGRLDAARALLQGAVAAHRDQVEPWVALASLWGEEAAERRRVLDEAERALGDRVELRLARAGLALAGGPDTAGPELAKLADGIDGFVPADRARLLTAWPRGTYESATWVAPSACSSAPRGSVRATWGSD